MKYLRSIFGLLSAGLLGLAAQAGTITSFNPEYGQPGGPSYITIIGVGFPKMVNPTVKFNGTNATFAQTVDVNYTTIQAAVPYGATTGPITIWSNSVLYATSSANFIVLSNAPYIHTFTPTTYSGPMVTLIGANLAAVTNVTISGLDVGPVFPVTDTELMVDVPPGVTTGRIAARSPTGAFTNTTQYFYVPPTITAFSPATGRSGTNLLITGTSFLGATAVQFAGVTGDFTISAVPTILSNQALQVSAPAGVMSGRLRVVAPGGSATTTNLFRVPPLITAFSPNAGAVNASVLVSGANLNEGVTIRFNGVAAAVNSVSFSQLTAVVPAGASTGFLSVSNTNGVFTTATRFYLPPVLSGFSPSNSPPGARIRLDGANFLDASSVSFNGIPSVFYITNNTTLGAIVPDGVLTGPITVTAPGGTATRTNLFFGPLSVTGFSPAEGVPGTVVTLYGQNLTGATAVRFNGVNAASIVPVNNGTLQATAPAGLTTGPITVVTPAGTNITAASFVLKTADLGLTLSAAPDPVKIGSNLVYTLTVANQGPFAATGVFLTNQLPASVTYVTNTLTQGALIQFSPLVASLGTLNAGQSAILTVTVTPRQVGPIQNLARAGSALSDPQPADNAATNTVTVQNLDLISLRPAAGAQVELSWPGDIGVWTVQYNTQFPAPAHWSNLPVTPVLTNSRWAVTDTNTGPARMYRLKK